MVRTSEYEIIPLSFYQRSDVVQISKDLIGKYLFHETEKGLTVGKIVETEAYNGRTDRACHAFHRVTKRTEVMYKEGGRAYVYLCYGIHYLFNIVTNIEGKADAVLIRALEPIVGLELMRERTKKRPNEMRLASGPGLVSKAMGFSLDENGKNLGEKFWVSNRRGQAEIETVALKRVGVDYSGKDADLLWRFCEAASGFVSR